MGWYCHIFHHNVVLKCKLDIGNGTNFVAKLIVLFVVIFVEATKGF